MKPISVQFGGFNSDPVEETSATDAKTLPQRSPVDHALRLQANVEQVQGETGVVPSHLIKLQLVAQEHRCLIGIRPVDPMATSLIESGHPTKGFHIKGKSANWGPQAALICVDQRWSKLENNAELVNKFNEQVEGCLRDQYAKKIPLSISRARVDELLGMRKIDRIRYDAQRNPVAFEARAPSGQIYSFEAKPVATSGGVLYEITHEGKPIEVLAPPKADARPLTADYDLFVIAPRIEELGPQDNVPVSDVAHMYFKARVDRYMNPVPGELKAAYADPAVFYEKEDKEIGNASPRIRALIPILNQALVGDGEPVIHHNADSASPAADPSANYPVTFALPEQIGRFDEICIVHDAAELAELVRAAKKQGFHVQLNPLWESEVTSVRRASYTQAREMLMSRLVID
ncbi:adenylate cyclase [Burkholderia stabilis]|uniref:Adenylate cyclase n=1 Tax=Burkholderia stabilis TaxID=95485 RepID=A0A4Q2A7V9_9BURK|nr:anthrax toxin-like adenylyl cyclase domain-containing protein [Burkholderia stabilis]RXV65293.1 adenylate cyclase [Burkholderia stabilis]